MACNSFNISVVLTHLLGSLNVFIRFRIFGQSLLRIINPHFAKTLPPSPGGIRLLTRKYPVSQSLALLPLLGTNHLTPIIATSLEVVALSCSTSQSLHNLSFIAQNHSHEVVEYLVRSMRKKLVCSAQGRLVLKILLLPLEDDYPLMIRTG